MVNRRLQNVAKALAAPRRFEIFPKIATAGAEGLRYGAVAAKSLATANGEVARMISLFLRNSIDNCKYVKTSKQGEGHERTRKNSSGYGCEQGAGL